MYLTPNFYKYTSPSYIGSQTASMFVNLISAWELRREARKELEKYKPKVDADSIYASAQLAFSALNNIMSRKVRLTTAGKPSLLEATLYAYLYLLLELPLESWPDSRLVEILRENKALVRWQSDMREEFGNLQPPGIYVVSK
jgi:metaxin